MARAATTSVPARSTRLGQRLGSTASSDVRTTIAAAPGARSAASSAGKSSLPSITVTGTRKAAHHCVKSGLTRLVPETRPGCARSWWMRIEA